MRPHIALALALYVSVAFSNAEDPFDLPDDSVCKKDEKHNSPVCGSDGETYESLCDYCIAQGLYEFLSVPTSLTITHAGTCGVLQDAALPPPEDKHLCGTDKVTYTYCEFIKKTIIEHADIKRDYDGECCKLTDNLQHLLCASDGKVYQSPCEFVVEQRKVNQQLWLEPAYCCKSAKAMALPECNHRRTA